MPCYTVKKTSVNMSNMNLELLKLGLVAAGFTVNQVGSTLNFQKDGSYRTHVYANGKLTVDGEDAEQAANEVKRAYSAHVIRTSMVRAGWKLTEKKSEKTVSFQASKRG